MAAETVDEQRCGSSGELSGDGEELAGQLVHGDTVESHG
jgi:hypothetical protein